MDDDQTLYLLKLGVSGWLYALDLKLSELQASLDSLESSILSLTDSHPPSSLVVTSLLQVCQCLDSQHQEVINKISDMTAISDCLDSSAPFADTANFHVVMLMTR
jgi:phage regulator Rha-like protein